jgi:hypothetical protein
LVCALIGPGKVSIWKVLACNSGSVDTSDDIGKSVVVEEAVVKGLLSAVGVAAEEALQGSLAYVTKSDRLVLTSIAQVPCRDRLGKICGVGGESLQD